MADTRDYPTVLRLIRTDGTGFIVEVDGSRRFLSREEAWQLAGQLVHPTLNVEPQGNC